MSFLQTSTAGELQVPAGCPPEHSQVGSVLDPEGCAGERAAAVVVVTHHDIRVIGGESVALGDEVVAGRERGGVAGVPFPVP